MEMILLKELDNNNKSFEDIKHVDENGAEFWYARELMNVLSYKDWRYFDAVIEKAKIACKNSELTDIDHFVVDNKMVEIGSGAKREQKDYKLTRYACYLIAQNANPRLKIVALAQTYFAVQTRKQEISENEANSTHYEVGKKVRKAIADIGGTMPENLPTPQKSLKQLEKETKKTLKQK